MSTIDIHKERMEEFDREFPQREIEGHINEDTWYGSSPAPKDLKSFLTHTLCLILEDDIKRLEGMKVEEGHTKPCKDVMEMNYQIGQHKGFNSALDAEITHKKSQLEKLK